MTVSEADWAALRDAVGGVVHRPGTPGYEVARRPPAATADGIRPQAVVQCASVPDVVRTIAFARRSGLSLTVRSGGHGFDGASSRGPLVLDVSRLRSTGLGVGTVRAGAGTRLGDLYDALATHRLAVPAGCGPAVGVSGLMLGGGIGLLGRRYGLTCDRLLSAEVVLADGSVVRCSEDREPDLFWMLRGGGAPGVVTEVVLATVRQPSATAFHLTWPAAAAVQVVDAWQRWAPDAPDDIAASLLLSATGGRETRVNVFGAMRGADLAALEPLVELAGCRPASTELRAGSYRDAKRVFTGFDVHGLGAPPDGWAACSSVFLGSPLPDATVGALVEHLDRPGPTRILDFMPMGGQYNRVPVDATAFVHRADRVLLKPEVVVPEGGDVDAGREWAREATKLARPDGTGRAYQNFADPALGDEAYYGDNLPRLLAVRRRYDPDGVFTNPERRGTAG